MTKDLFENYRVISDKVLYRVTMVVGDMGWVIFDFGRSTICQVLPRQIGVLQNGLRN